MKLGQKFTEEIAEAKASAGFIRGFKDGETTLRFLEEMEEGSSTGPWTAYREHYDPTAKVSYPCLGDKQLCPGCNSDNERERRASQRYLVNALTSDGYVNLYRVPQSIINNLLKFSRKYGSITDRDYTIDKSGQGLNTEYAVIPEDKAQVDIEQYADDVTPHDKALEEAFVDAWGQSPEEIADQMRSGVYPAKPSGGGRDLAKAPEEDRRPRTRRAAVESSSEFSGEPPFSQPQEKSEDSSGDDEVTFDRDDLLGMSKLGLKKVYKRLGVEYPTDGDYGHEELVDFLIEEAAE